MPHICPFNIFQEKQNPLQRSRILIVWMYICIHTYTYSISTFCSVLRSVCAIGGMWHCVLSDISLQPPLIVLSIAPVNNTSGNGAASYITRRNNGGSFCVFTPVSYLPACLTQNGAKQSGLDVCENTHLHPGSLMDPRESSLFIAIQEALSIIIPQSPASYGRHPGRFRLNTCGPRRPSLKWPRCTSESSLNLHRWQRRGNFLQRAIMCCVDGGGKGAALSRRQLRDVDMAPFVVDSSRGGFIKPTHFLRVHRTARVIPVLFPPLHIGG